MWRLHGAPRVAPEAGAPPGGAPGAAGTPLEESVDALLRFAGGGAAGAARLEAAFIASLARTMRVPRTVCLIFLGITYAAIAASTVYLTSATAVPINWAYLAVSALSFALVPAVRARAACVVDLAAGAGATLALFAFNFDGAAALTGMCATGRYTDFLLFIALPLVVGVMFAPRWRMYAALCAAHGCRAVAELSVLGVEPPLFVCIACVLGSVLLYLQERRVRVHFVRCRGAPAFVVGCPFQMLRHVSQCAARRSSHHSR